MGRSGGGTKKRRRRESEEEEAAAAEGGGRNPGGPAGIDASADDGGDDDDDAADVEIRLDGGDGPTEPDGPDGEEQGEEERSGSKGGLVEEEDDEGTKKKKKKVRKLSLKATEDFNAKLRRRGVLYLSRIPPRMGPAKVKSLLSDFGTVTRVYLVEEDRAARKRRRRMAGTSGAGGKRYVEGWVEFEDKKVARMVGERLNNTPITNHKRSVHHGDLWNVRYLRKFKWEHLTEKVAYERRVREQKMRVELMQARRENAAYAEKVEKGMALDHIEERRRKRNRAAGGSTGAAGEDAARPARKFRQMAVLEEDGVGPAKSAVLGSLV